MITTLRVDLTTKSALRLYDRDGHISLRLLLLTAGHWQFATPHILLDLARLDSDEDYELTWGDVRISCDLEGLGMRITLGGVTISQGPLAPLTLGLKQLQALAREKERRAKMEPGWG